MVSKSKSVVVSRRALAGAVLAFLLLVGLGRASRRLVLALALLAGAASAPRSG